MASPDDAHRPGPAGAPRPVSGHHPAARPSVFFPERYGLRDAGHIGRVRDEPEPTIDELFSQAEALRRTAPHPVVRNLHRWRREAKEVAVDAGRLAQPAGVRARRWLSAAVAIVSAWGSRTGRAIRSAWSTPQPQRRPVRLTLRVARRSRPPRVGFVLSLVTIAILLAGSVAWPPQDTLPTPAPAAAPAEPADAVAAAGDETWPHAAVAVALDAAKQTVAAADTVVEASSKAPQRSSLAGRADATDVEAAPAIEGPYRGTLVIDSRPAGAHVSVDGVARGRSPVSIGRLEAGSHVVRVDLPGYRRWGWAVQVVANQRTRIDVQLVPATGEASHASP